jgi:F-type H+-transporting ATPase subunit a
MVTDLRDLRHTRATQVLGDVLRILTCDVVTSDPAIVETHGGERSSLINHFDMGLVRAPAGAGRKTPRSLKVRWIRMLFIAAFISLSGSVASAMSDQPGTNTARLDGAAENVASGAIPEQEEHGLSQKAVEITRVFGFPITNSMVVTWIVSLGLIVFAQAATRKMKQVPGGAQNFLEWLVESLYSFLEGILGRHLVERTFWFFGTVFIFILAANWVGLIPGVGTMGWGRETSHGFRIDQPLFRGANADVNQTLAMALIFFACWIVWALREVGPLGFVKELFGAKGESSGAMKVLLAVVFFAAGCLEIISILFRPVSLSFRLYGNIFAGENMLEPMATLAPGFGWLLPIPFYFLELLVGLIQAMVFMLLTAVFTLLICQHEDKGPATAH